MQTDSKADLLDLTKDLSDAEIEAALGDLTLSDLNVLSQFIDAPKIEKSLDFDDDRLAVGWKVLELNNWLFALFSFLSSNEGARAFYGMSMDGMSPAFANTNNEAPIDNVQKMTRDLAATQDLIKKYVPYRFTNMGQKNKELSDYLRAKRENPSYMQPVGIDEEYIKQLENSFPQEQGVFSQEQGVFSQEEENSNEEADHVRIKRS